MKVSIYHDLIQLSKAIWIDHLNNVDSMFYKGYKTENLLKSMFPQFRKGKTLALLKILKLEALKGLSDDKRFGVYPSQTYLAKQLGCSQQSISEMLRRLEKIRVIKLIRVAIQSKTKTCRTKVLIIPHPSLMKTQRKLRTRLSQLPTRLSQLPTGLSQLPTGLSQLPTNLGQLPTKLSQLPTGLRRRYPMITDICKHHFRILFRILKYQDSKYQDSKYQDSFQELKYTSYIFNSRINKIVDASITPVCNSFLTNGKQTEQFVRYKLKSKSIEKQVSIDNYGLNPRSFLPHIDKHILLDKCLKKLVKENICPMLDETIKVLDYWNGKNNDLFAKIRNTYTTDVFKQLQVMVTFAIHFHMVPLETLIQAIDTFDSLSRVSHWLTYYKKKHSLPFTLLSGRKHGVLGESWLDICQLPEQEAIAKTCGTCLEYKLTFDERLRPSFINHFYPGSEDIGLDAFTENYGTFAKFSDKMVAYHKKHNMCGLSMKGLFDKYFDYILKKSANWGDDIPSVRFITNFKWVTEFIRLQQHQQGWEKFGTEYATLENNPSTEEDQEEGK